jgi:hypothetical protein
MNQASHAVQSATPLYSKLLRFVSFSEKLQQALAFVTVAVERASYNGSIEASQASDVGSIPIARSNQIKYLQTHHAALAAPFESN